MYGFYGTDDCGQTCNAWMDANFDDDASGQAGKGSSFSSRLFSSSLSNVAVPGFCDYSSAVVFVWTPGAANTELPDDVGFRFGNMSGGFTSVGVQTHYDNPSGTSGVVDSSGVRVYYTEELRPIDMGVIQLGDPSVLLSGVPLSEGKSTILFDCPSSCTEEVFEVCVCVVR